MRDPLTTATQRSLAIVDRWQQRHERFQETAEYQDAFEAWHEDDLRGDQ
tara:strand:+ start:181 stop:327 length:147 start_codon:yes stop_codon:yes gene_type:complete